MQCDVFSCSAMATNNVYTVVAEQGHHSTRVYSLLCDRHTNELLDKPSTIEAVVSVWKGKH